MANNYAPCTIEPLIPKALFTEEELDKLTSTGLSYDEDSDGLLYFYSEEGFYEETDDGDSIPEIFQKAIEKAKTTDNLIVEQDIDEIVIKGAYYCSKMRPGEFGGFIIRITKDSVQGGSTDSILELFRQGGII